MDARVWIYGYAFSCLNVRSWSPVLSVLWKAIMPDYCKPHNLPGPSRCWVDTNSVSPAPNRFLRLQSTMLSRLSWRFFFKVLYQSVCVYIRLHQTTMTRLRELVSTPSEMWCNDTVQLNIDMHFMCKYGRKNEYLPVYIFMLIYIWLLYWVF